MAIRRVLRELEARLEPVGQAASRTTVSGKLELKRYGDGRQRMKIKCKGLEVPDGTRLELLNRETVVAILTAQGGRAELDETRDGSDKSPPLAAGDMVRLCHHGIPLLGGRLYLD